MIDESTAKTVILKARQLEEIPSICYNCKSTDLKRIMGHIEGHGWLCHTCNHLNVYEPTTRFTKEYFPFYMIDLRIDEIELSDTFDFE